VSELQAYIHRQAKHRQVAGHAWVTLGLLGVAYGLSRQLGFPEPWWSLNDVWIWWVGITAVSLISGPGLVAWAVHPYQTAHWRRDFFILVLIQGVLTTILVGLLWTSRPVVAALVGGDWIVLSANEFRTNNRLTGVRSVVVVPTSETVKKSWEEAPESWKIVSPDTLKAAGRWDLRELDREWSSAKKDAWLAFKSSHPEWATLGAYPIYGSSRSGWWLWDIQKGEPVTLLNIRAPLDGINLSHEGSSKSETSPRHRWPVEQ
jgi:hypothetical protein